MGMLNVVGIGPGAIQHMTILAYNTLKNSDVIVGYTGYTALIEKEFHDKEIISTGMGSEEERCRIALNIANSGKAVSLICSGDSVISACFACLRGRAQRRQRDTLPNLARWDGRSSPFQAHRANIAAAPTPQDNYADTNTSRSFLNLAGAYRADDPAPHERGHCVPHAKLLGCLPPPHCSWAQEPYRLPLAQG